MAEYLVTGGAGFIGSHLVEELVRRGKKVRILDNFSSGKWANIAAFKDRIEVIEGDVRDLKTCDRACAGVRYVSHQAALGSVPASIDDPLKTHEVNATGTLNMLLAARKAGTQRFVFASSSAIYGESPEMPKRESMAPDPLSPYALSKLTAETFCIQFTRLYGLPTVSLRYFNIFGPRQDEAGQYAAVIPKFCQALCGSRAPVIFGDGEQTRDFCYVNNAVTANLSAFESSEGAWGRTYNIACGQGMTLNELLRVLQSDLNELDPGTNIVKPRYEPARPGDIRESLADTHLAKRHLGYEAQVGVREGLRLTLNWYLEMSKLKEKEGRDRSEQDNLAYCEL